MAEQILALSQCEGYKQFFWISATHCSMFFDSVLAENSYEILEVLQLSRLFILDLMSHLKETLQVSDEGIEKLISCSNFMNLMALKILQFYSQEVGWDSHLDENLLASLTFNLALSEQKILTEAQLEEQLSTFKAKMRQHNWKQQIGIDWVKELGKQFTPAQWDRFEAKMLLIGKFLMTSSETVPMSMATIMLNSLQYVIKNQSRESVREIMKLKQVQDHLPLLEQLIQQVASQV